MKKIIYNICAVLCVFASVSCGDMLETDSVREIVDPTLSSKTDSVTYATGVLQALQELADQYYYANELRGDLVTTTDDTEEALRDIANYNVSTSTINKYDSVYLYYKVINNCNYYLTHRDSAMYSGSTNVSRDEYICIAAIRAWTYLQMARLYEKVPYVTKPLTTIANINNDDSPTLTGKEILDKEKDFLKSVVSNFYNTSDNGSPNYHTTTFGTASVDIGTTNWGTKKYVNPRLCFVPVDVVLGDICLELDQFDEAARYYFTYLNNEATLANNYLMTQPALAYKDYISSESLPSDYVAYKSKTQSYLFDKQADKDKKNQTDWYKIFSMQATPVEVVSYIPMAVNYTRGKTTTVPQKFGFDFYASSGARYTQTRYVNNCPQSSAVEIVPSTEYNTLADTALFYYQNGDKKALATPITGSKLGDARSIVVSRGSTDTTQVYNEKVSGANIYLYRISGIYLHLAEALNRQGYPDLAFAILKDGLNADLKNYVSTAVRAANAAYYIKESSYNYLLSLGGYRTSTDFDVKYQTSESKSNTNVTKTVGVHMHGCGMVDGVYSTYQYKNVVADKMDYLKKKFGMTYTNSINDTINAVEDLICDEMAMELAFEGCRYSDLQRIAHHKNNAGLYGSLFGSRWLGKKIVAAGRKSVTDENMFLNEKNWYLPYINQ